MQADSYHRSTGIDRLVEVQERAVLETKSRLNEWEKFKDDYVKLGKKLSSLPENVTHDHMVPFGPLAYMPGQLVHTNEVLVLLGDNWFAEMSAKQASGVTDRRLAEIENSIEKLKGQLYLIESRSHFTDKEFSSHDEVDITEEYDSDKEREWRKSHKLSVQRHKKKENTTTCHTDEHVLSRLDELQLQELVNKEIKGSGELLDDSIWQKDSSSRGLKKGVHWPDEVTDTGGIDTELSPLDSDDSDEHPPVIYFSHSPRADELDGDYSKDEVGKSPPSNSDGHINSPRDLYKIFDRPKSILKKQSNPTIDTIDNISMNVSQTSPSPKRSLQPKTATAVKGRVVERSIDTGDDVSTNVSVKQETKPTTTTTATTEKPARLSKFKAMRQKRAS